MSRTIKTPTLAPRVQSGLPLDYNALKDAQESAKELHHLLVCSTGQMFQTPSNLTGRIPIAGVRGSSYDEANQPDHIVPFELPSGVKNWGLMIHFKLFGARAQTVKFRLVNPDTGDTHLMHSIDSITDGTSEDWKHTTGALPSAFLVNAGDILQVNLEIESTIATPQTVNNATPDTWYGVLACTLIGF